MADDHIWTFINVNATSEFIEIKFDDTLNTSSITDNKFSLINGTWATPGADTSALKPINLSTDYSSISRTLYLYFKDTFDLAPGGTYTLTMTGLRATGQTAALPNDYYTFTMAGAYNPPDPDTDGGGGIAGGGGDESIVIVNKSLKNPTFPIDVEEVSSGTAFLNIVSVTPNLNESFQIGESDFEGKITVEFDDSPAANFVTSSDFRLQKKVVGGTGKWQDVATSVVAESSGTKVSVFLPSTDATPIYSYQVIDDETHTFWEPTYKYRLIVSKNIGY